ncbi:MAG TPA: YceI family protein [Novosphingobium sp.]|nr:YceI family protein [Novosphingobium sp.]
MRLIAWFAVVVLCGIPHVAAQGDTRHYVVDPANSAVDARVAFFAFASKTAHFPDMSGSMNLSLSDFGALNMVVDIDARTLTTGDSETRRLRGRQFFDVAHYPTVHFVGTRMELTGERTADVAGMVTAKGITRPISLKIVFSSPPADADTSDPISVVGSGTIDRRQFGMSAFPLIIGNQVHLTIDARMVPG